MIHSEGGEGESSEIMIDRKQHRARYRGRESEKKQRSRMMERKRFKIAN